MEFSELIQKRYSVRAYRPDPVAEDVVQKVLEAARIAPTAANRQPFRLILAHPKGREAEFESIYPREWFYTAPLMLCVCGVGKEGWVRKYDSQPYLMVDAGIVMDHIILEATNQGLGTCWVAAFNPAAARKVLALPEDVTPIVFTPLGYPADSLRPKERRPLDDLVHYEHW